MKKSPLAIVKERFGEDAKAAKAKLVAELRTLTEGDLWIERLNDGKGLERVSNRKLLHLHDALSRVKSEFGSRDGLINAILGLERREKDAGYRQRLEKFPTPRLIDEHAAAKRRASA
ncbi:MAG: hypothetical protein OEY14_11170 [Myxococcales bacterium]|nr:hypothetical protein [Myxococcales bacterium]